MRYLDYIRRDQFIVLDIETTGLNPRLDQILSIAWWSHSKQGCLLLSEFEDTPSLTWQQHIVALVPELADENIAKVIHNVGFDTAFLYNNGLKFTGPKICSILLAQMVNENRRLGLDVLAKIHLEEGALDAYHAIEAWRISHGQKSGDYSQAPKSLLTAYNLEDVRNTYKIAKLSVAHLDNTHKFLTKTFKFVKTPVDYLEEEAIPFEECNLKLSNRGIRINIAAVKQAETESSTLIAAIISKLDAATKDAQEVIVEDLHQKAKDKKKTQRGKDYTPRPKFNWASGQQVGRLIYEVLDLKNYYVGKSETGQYSTSEDHINTALLKNIPTKLRDVLTLLLELKSEQKFLSTDVRGLLASLEGDFLYPTFKQTSDDKTPGKGTATGRLSSSRNVQNIPPRARHFYIPTNPDNVFIYADYSQLELRIAAHLSNDRKMVETFKRDGDIHQLTATGLFPGQEITDKLRKIAKTSNFLKIYGGSPNRHQQQLFHDAQLVMALSDLQEIDRNFFELYSDYKRFLDSLKQFLRSHKFIYSPSGRIRRLPDLEYSSGLNRHKKFYAGKDYTKLKAAQEAYNRKKKQNISLFEYVSKLVRHAINQGLNFPGQSLGATICKRAVMDLFAEGFDVVNNIHDAVLIEVPAADCKTLMPKIKQIMESAYKLKVPLKVEIKVLKSFSEKDVYELAA